MHTDYIKYTNKKRCSNAVLALYSKKDCEDTDASVFKNIKLITTNTAITNTDKHVIKIEFFTYESKECFCNDHSVIIKISIISKTTGLLDSTEFKTSENNLIADNLSEFEPVANNIITYCNAFLL